MCCLPGAFDEISRLQRISSLARVAGQQNPPTSSQEPPTYQAIEDAIRRALKDVGDRDGGRKRRNSEPRSTGNGPSKR